jgi:hypothetical protein
MLFIFILPACVTIIGYVLYQIVMMFGNSEDKTNPESDKLRAND